MAILRKYFVTVHLMQNENGPVEMVQNVIFWGSTYESKSDGRTKGKAKGKI